MTDVATLIEQTLERLAEVTDDITPNVYKLFFAIRPEAEGLFGDSFDMGRGRMLNDVFVILMDQPMTKAISTTSSRAMSAIMPASGSGT